jgi:hypothetical protein
MADFVPPPQADNITAETTQDIASRTDFGEFKI